MSKTLLFIISLCTLSIGYSQKDRDSTRKGSSLDLMYGIYTYNQNINNQTNSFKKFEFGKPIQAIGISFTSTFLLWRLHNTGFHLSYSQVVAQKIAINDTLNGKVNGFNFSCNIIGYDLTPKSHVVSLVVGGGFNTGRLRITSENLRSQKNPFFAPTLFFNPRFFVGPVVIALRFEYQFDVSKKGWRSVNVSKELDGFLLNNFSHTGLLTYFSVGWNLSSINNKNNKKKHK